MRGQAVGTDQPTRARFALGILFALAFAATLWASVTAAASPAAHADSRGAGESSAARTTVNPKGTATAVRTAFATSATPTSSRQTSPTTNRAARTFESGPESPAPPRIQMSTEPTRIDPAVMATLSTPSAATAAAASGASANNLGFGNVGQWNLGNGNAGDFNVGSGNAGDRNVGFGNLGSDNIGAGNSGDGNVGLGNTGNNNIGFGNTGNNCVGIGLTGDNQVGFGGWNSGTGNTGLFNSGSGNSGFFNSGTGNFGIGNSGSVNTGLFNAGGFNTGVNNVGSYNTGHANAGDANTGGFNSGNTNTGWANTGNANTGLANSGNVNTGAFISGNLSNGFFVTGDEQNWLPSVRYTTTLPGLTIDDNLPLTIDQTTTSADLTVIVGPTTANVHVTGTTAPIEVVLFETPSGPGFFNSTDSPSSGFFNSGSGGGSGLFNVGEGVSGLWNAAVAQFMDGAVLVGPALVSGLGNYGLLTSGLGNLGAGISGLSNRSSLDPSVAASLAGLGNVGSGFAGVWWNSVTGLPALNLGFGDVGSLNIGGGNVGDFNLGFGNVGRRNLGNGNVGDGNVGSGNAGDGNVGFGNLGSGNVGAGNTGNNNIGFGNTGNNCVGIGLTGDNQVGFGGWNSGTNNTGLFNSGSGNSGFFNSGTGNTGLFNAGRYNTGWSNAGNYNTGYANTGDANSGGFNTGRVNTGWLNTGDANTGLANGGNLNTGALNLGNRNNGALWRSNDNGQLNIGLGLTISEIPVNLAADVPVDVPVVATIGPDVFDVLSFTVPTIPGGLALTPITLNATIVQPGVKVVAGPIVFNENPDVAIGPIAVPTVTVSSTDPLLSGRIGGQGTSLPVRIGGSIGQTRVSLLAFGGPGLFNSIVNPSSGFFNSSGGVDIGATVSPILVNLGARIPLDVPISADLGSVGTLGATIPGFNISTTNWTTIVNQVFNATVDGVNLREVFDFTVLNGTIPVGDITVPAVTVDLPAVTGAIGGAATSIPVNFTAETAPFRILPLLAGAGARANAGAVPAAGGSSGLFNSGAGLSGLLNQGVLGSGTGNAGAGNSGWVNTGTGQSGALRGWPGIGTLLGRVIDRLRPVEPRAVRGVTVTDILLGYALDVPIDVPVGATFDEFQIPLVAIPTVTLGPGPVIQAALLNRASGGDYPGNNPCGAPTNRGACVPLELKPLYTVGGGAGPITIKPGGILTPNGQQVFSTAIGGIGRGISASGTVGAGPINIVAGSPVTVEQFPYVYQGAVTTDVPVTTDIGLTISQADLTDILQGTLDYKYGYCYYGATGNACTPDNLQKATSNFSGYCDGNNPGPNCHITYFVWGTNADSLTPPIDRSYRGYPRGPFPPDSVLLTGTKPLPDNSGAFTVAGRYLNFVLNSGTANTTSFSGSGTAGPFPRSGG